QTKNWSRAQFRTLNIKQGQAYPDCSDNFDQRPGGLHRPDDAHHLGELQLIAALECLFLMRFARKGLDHSNTSERFLHRYYHFAHAFKLTSHGLSGATPIIA